MPLTEQSVYEALRQVHDPELFVNIVDLGLVYEVRLTASGSKTDVYVLLTMTSPACPAAPLMMQQVKDVITRLGEEVGKVEVQLTLDPPWMPDRMSEEARDTLGLF